MKVAEDQVVEDDASFQDDEVRHFKIKIKGSPAVII